jgi:predicted acetyltransferase
MVILPFTRPVIARYRRVVAFAADRGGVRSGAVTVTLHPIGLDEHDVLRRVWELYAHDFSEFMPRLLGADGRFETDAEFARMTAPPLDLLWIHADSALAGFVFVRPHSQITGEPRVSDIAQFFVVRGHRRAGVGRTAAAQAFARRPGRWEVRVAAQNTAARRSRRSAEGAGTDGGRRGGAALGGGCGAEILDVTEPW